MAKKNKAFYKASSEGKKKFKDSELMVLREQFLEKTKMIDNSAYTLGQYYNFNGLDLKNLKRQWEI